MSKWESIGRIVCNAAISGAISGLSMYFVHGDFDPTVSGLAALATGLLSFFIELKTALGKETHTAGKKGSSRSGWVLFS